jgi:hypothetical protein
MNEIISVIFRMGWPVREAYGGDVPPDWPAGLGHKVMQRISRDADLRQQLREAPLLRDSFIETLSLPPKHKYSDEEDKH